MAYMAKMQKNNTRLAGNNVNRVECGRADRFNPEANGELECIIYENSGEKEDQEVEYVDSASFDDVKGHVGVNRHSEANVLLDHGHCDVNEYEGETKTLSCDSEYITGGRVQE